MLSLEESGLSAQTYNRTIAAIVERGRTDYRDAYLWAWLRKLNAEQDKLDKAIPLFVRISKSKDKDWRLWQRELERVIVRLNANQDMIDGIVWHLENRGDTEVAYYMETTESLQRENNKVYQNRAYYIAETLGLN